MLYEVITVSVFRFPVSVLPFPFPVSGFRSPVSVLRFPFPRFRSPVSVSCFLSPLFHLYPLIIPKHVVSRGYHLVAGGEPFEYFVELSYNFV